MPGCPSTCSKSSSITKRCRPPWATTRSASNANNKPSPWSGRWRVTATATRPVRGRPGLPAGVGVGPVRQLHGAVERQSRRRALPDPFPVRGLRVLPARPVLPARSRRTHRQSASRPRNRPGHERSRLCHRQPDRRDRRVLRGERTDAPPSRRSRPDERAEVEQAARNRPARAARRIPVTAAPGSVAHAQ